MVTNTAITPETNPAAAAGPTVLVALWNPRAIKEHAKQMMAMTAKIIAIINKTSIFGNIKKSVQHMHPMQCGFIGPYKFGKLGQMHAYVIYAMDDCFFYPIAADYIVKIMPR